jgi:hypothetical protein
MAPSVIPSERFSEMRNKKLREISAMMVRLPDLFLFLATRLKLNR